ncbi:MAG: hypothetical protein RIB93_32995 [Coleofasciculus sp. D1-CHI-01]|uniref:hypothetical protein n=1 Tax=Coleofasciculus sp. D1-CHI-01 TaxID=3068482 RepID=UPI0032F33B76
MTYSIASTERSVSEPTPRQRSTGGKPPNSSKSDSSTSNVHSLAVLWARKYYTAVTNQDQDESVSSLAAADLKETASLEARKSTAEKMMQKLNFASAQAWSLTETLLSEEIRRHGINPELVNPLEIAADTRYLFQKTANAYAQRATPRRLSVIVGKDFGKVRQKYTSVDRRAIGFVSMQFHYTGQKLLDWLSPAEQKLWLPYLKVMDDHMYMPLQAAYDAAANHPYNSPALLAVQSLLPISTKLAISVCQQVCRQNPNYETYSGSLMSKTVRIASIRDVEMFQVYLCLCVLEDDIRAVQRELFPLCVMLYPRLRVGWRLVQDMLKAIGWEMYNRLPPENMATFLPYLRTLTEMFSCDVFQEPE